MSRGDIVGNILSHVQVYRVSRGWRLFFAVLSPPLVFLFGWFMMMPFREGRSNQIGYVVLSLVLGGGGVLFFLYALLSVFKGKIEVYPDRIRDVCLFKTTELLISEISGFRVLPTQSAPTLLLLPKDSKIKKIKTALIVEQKADLFDWLNRNLTNLDAVDFQKEMNQVLHDTNLGETEDQRLWVLDRARRWSRILNGLGIVVLLWAFFRPQPYPYAIWTLILLPLISLGFVRHFDGVLRFDGKEQSAFPNVAPAFLMPCIGLAFRAFIDFKIVNWDKFWFPFGLSSLFLYFVILLFAKDVRQKIGTAIMLVLFCAIYGYSAVISLNGILDTTTPSIYKALVMEKRVSKGKHTSYYLKLSPWGPRKDEQEVDVGKSVYDSRETGDRADVVVRNGRLGIPWFYVR